jgi:putative nucleotidyltransferase with HDIG domain
MTAAPAETKIINFRPPRRLVAASWQPAAMLALFSVAVFLSSVVALNWELVPGRQPLKAGDAAPDTIKAPRRATYVSQSRTRAARDTAAAQVPNAYDYDSNLLRQLRGRAADTLRSLSAVRADTTVADDLRRQQIVRLEPGLSSASVNAVLEMSEAEWLAVNAEALRILDANVRERITAEELGQRRAAAIAQIVGGLTAAQQAVVADVVSLYTRPNVLVNPAETDRARQQTRERVPPVQVTVERGDVVVRQGDVITAEDLEKLEALGLGTRAFSLQNAAGVMVFCALVVALLAVYVYTFHLHDLVVRPRSLLLVGLLMVGSLLVMKLVVPGRPWVAYAFPSAIASMLISNLLSTRLALIIGLFIALLSAPVFGYSFEMACLVVLQCFVGALATRRIERLNAFFLAGFQVALANVAVVLTFRLINQDYDWVAMANLGLAGLVNGLLAAILTMGTFSVVGSLFGLTTMLQLLELAHPSQPLLRRLLTEAPGTYHHSIIVGNLAERAAEQIGIDSLLVRVGAYYHDIGKLHPPFYYAENQFDGDNIHDRLRPEASAAALIDHVTYGQELARQYGLPPAVKAFVSEHHGTRLASFFYRKAVKLATGAGSDHVDEASFRYPGPRPLTKGTALVMLADTVEASVRAASNRTTQSLEQLVEKAVNERLLEGELDECDLTLKDLETIKRSFTKQLQGVYHPRIEYPEPAELEAAPVQLLGAAEPS